MSFHFFAVPALDPEAEQGRLNDFCQRHRVVAVDRQFVAAGADSHWAICVQIAQGPGQLPEALRLRADRHAPADGSHRNPVDWKQVLNEADFQVVAQLRSLRKTLAESAGVPVFAVFSNEQLAAMVQTRPASLADRVLHHALLNLTEARFEQALVPGSFACRPGLGVHAAVGAVQRHLQRFAWYVRVDVAGYFPSINHGLLRQLLASRFKGAEHLALWHRIIDAGRSGNAEGEADGEADGEGAGDDAVGLPIGALTSQHLANAYLDSADRFLLALPAVRAVVRYMDDIVWWCDSAADARQTLALLRQQLWDRRRLRLKPNPQLGRSDAGLAFCGFRVRPGVVLPSQRKLQRFKAGAARLAQACLHGYGSDPAIACSQIQRALRRPASHLGAHPEPALSAGGVGPFGCLGRR